MITKFAICFLIALRFTQSFTFRNPNYYSSLSIDQRRNTILHDTVDENVGSKKQKRLSNLLNSVDFVRTPSEHETVLKDDPLIPLVETIVLAADKRKATYISAFRVSHLTEITSFMVIIEGRSAPQNQAIALSIEEDVEKSFTEEPIKQGVAASGWILLDYASVLVHIMTPQMRAFYKLEKRWKDAEILDLNNLLDSSIPNSELEKRERERENERERLLLQNPCGVQLVHCKIVRLV